MMSAARKAIELDPDLSEPHVLLAGVYQKQWQWSDAEAEFKRALELNSNDTGAHVGYAKWLLCQGRTDEALAWAQRARNLDPLGGAVIRLEPLASLRVAFCSMRDVTTRPSRSCETTTRTIGFSASP